MTGEERNPDRSRRALFGEFILVLTVLWLPILIAGAINRVDPVPPSVNGEIYGYGWRPFRR